MEFKMKRLIGLLACFTVSFANAIVVDFESGLDDMFNYVEVTAGSSSTLNSGYVAMTEYTGSNKAVFNPHAASPSTFSWNSAGTFDLTSFAITGAWGSQTLTVEGLFNGEVQHTSLLAVDNLAVNIFSADWLALDQFRITTGDDFILDDSVSGRGQHWVLDNLTINESMSVPAPALFMLLGLGLGGFALSKKKKVV